MMVKFGRTNHLSHPLCEALLRQKWLTYGFLIYVLNLCFYLLFLFTFSYFIITFSSCNHHDSTHSSSSFHSCPNIDFISFEASATTAQILCIRYVVLYCFINFILEIVQIIQDGRDYLNDLENYAQWTLYISTSVFAIPFLFDQSWHYQWVAGSIGIFSAYFALLFLLGRFDIYGIYVLMFLEILKTLLHVLSLFSILIIGFALTFCIIRPFAQDLHPSNPHHLFMIIMKTVTMMLGELDYDRGYIETANDHHFSVINLVMLLLFAVIMPILLMNLLVGLAIGDLMQIQQNARIKRFALQVQHHTNLEKIIPNKLIKRWTKNEFTVRLNKCVHYNVSSLFTHMLTRSVNTKDILDAKEECQTENPLFSEIYKQKQRQKDMQRQLEKITDLVRLVAQKMEIPGEMEVDDTSKTDKVDSWKKFQKFRQTFNIARRFTHRQLLTQDSSSHEFHPTEKV